MSGLIPVERMQWKVEGASLQEDEVFAEIELLDTDAGKKVQEDLDDYVFRVGVIYERDDEVKNESKVSEVHQVVEVAAIHHEGDAIA